MTRPPQPARMAVALGVSVAMLVYSASLALQRAVPAVKDALAVTVMSGVKPTYYVRVIVSIVIGAAAAVVAPRRAVPERAIALGVAIALAISVALACAFP